MPQQFKKCSSFCSCDRVCEKSKNDLAVAHIESQEKYLDLNSLKKAYSESIPQQEGEKSNKYKLPMSKLFLQFPDALQAVILASCYGNFKYPKDTDWLNFKRVPGGSQNYRDAEIRHFLGGENDEESGLPEIFHQAWNKLAELQLWMEENNLNIKEYSKEYLRNLK